MIRPEFHPILSFTLYILERLASVFWPVGLTMWAYLFDLHGEKRGQRRKFISSPASKGSKPKNINSELSHCILDAKLEKTLPPGPCFVGEYVPTFKSLILPWTLGFVSICECLSSEISSSVTWFRCLKAGTHWKHLYLLVIGFQDHCTHYTGWAWSTLETAFMLLLWSAPWNSVTWQSNPKFLWQFKTDSGLQLVKCLNHIFLNDHMTCWPRINNCSVVFFPYPWGYLPRFLWVPETMNGNEYEPSTCIRFFPIHAYVW